MPKPKLTATVLTVNSEDCIRECLDSFIDVVDEVVILDSISTDQTESICRSYDKVRFFQHPFDGHIQQKNRALDHCDEGWVLCIDPDERVTPELQKSIAKLIQNDPSDVVGAKFKRLTFHLGQFIHHGGWYPNARYRLIRQGKGRWGGENPHDCLEIEGGGITLDGDLLHFSFIDLADQVETINKFSSIVAHTRYRKGKKTSMFRLLAKPLSKFLEIYLLKRGCKDGVAGLVIAVSSAYSTFLKEAKLRELNTLDLDAPSNLPPYYEKSLK